MDNIYKKGKNRRDQKVDECCLFGSDSAFAPFRKGKKQKAQGHKLSISGLYCRVDLLWMEIKKKLPLEPVISAT
jgi:hypothetical protein